MATLQYERFWAVSCFLALVTPVWAGEASTPSLQLYQELALQAAIGQKSGKVVNSPQLPMHPKSPILSARSQDLIAKEQLPSADTTKDCIVPLHQYQAESKLDKGLERQAGPESGDAIKTFHSAPVCRTP